MKTSILWRALAWCVLALAFGMAVYRAKTQTIAHDESLEFEWFLDGGVYRVLQYNPTNHVLFTLMAKPVVWTLGVSEFIVRIPSLLGAALYLLAAYLLCRRLFGEGVLLFLSVAMLCLNPQILDFMAAARGYILGLAGLAAAMYAMAQVVERGEFNPEDSAWRNGCVIASIALALSVVANFTNAVPVACLALTFSLEAMGGFRELFRWRERKLQCFAVYFLLPGAATGFCLLWPYLIQVRPANFYAGMAKTSDALRDLFTASFLYKWTEGIYAISLGAAPSHPERWQDEITIIGMYLLLPLLFCMVAAGLILAWRSAASPRSTENAYCRVFGGSAIATVVLIVMLHVAVNAHYPSSRLCLFLIPLFTLGGILSGRAIYARFPRWYLKTAGLLIAAVVVFDYALSLQVTQFRYNAYDVISLRLYQTIADDAKRRGLTTVRVGGTWWYEPEINFYRRKFKAAWMMDYDIKDKSYWWQTPNDLKPPDYDYFVFTPAGDPGLTGPHVKTIFQDAHTGITIVANEK